MNISSEISSVHEYNSSDCFIYSGTGVETDFSIHIIWILLYFPINSYVIWLIVTGTGNGLAAEIFILSLSVCEMILCFSESFLFLLKLDFAWIVGYFFDGLAIMGRPLFQSLICVERYLAVVHPVIFLKFKPLRYRLMCSAVAWVATVVYGGFNVVTLLFSVVLYIALLIGVFIVFFSIQLFCCVSVLRALKQSGPGERGREREEENSMKKRAFHLILITTVTMSIMSGPYIFYTFVATDIFRLNNSITVVYIGYLSFTLTGLVQPVFSLYRVRKLNIIKCQLNCYKSTS